MPSRLFHLLFQNDLLLEVLDGGGPMPCVLLDSKLHLLLWQEGSFDERLAGPLVFLDIGVLDNILLLELGAVLDCVKPKRLRLNLYANGKLPLGKR